MLPRLLAEARKFGIAVVIAHQHLQQLTPTLREAALAATNSVVSFRSGPAEAAATMTRLGSWAGASLPRLPKFHAAATLATAHGVTDPFTLRVDHNTRAVPNRERADRVVRASRQRASDPYRWLESVTVATIDAAVKAAIAGTANQGPGAPRESGSGFLDPWLERRAQQKAQLAQEDPAKVQGAPSASAQ